MKKAMGALALLFVLLAQTALGDTFGPPQPTVKRGEYALGLGALVYAAEWDLSIADISEDKANQNKFYLHLGYGFARNWEGYARLGTADLKIRNLFGGKDFRGDYEPYATLGLRGLIRKTPSFQVGLFGQGSYYANYDDSKTIGGTTFAVDVESNWEAQVGLSLQKEIEGALLYGGPVLFMREGDLSLESSSGASFSSTYEENNNLGGFVGIQWPLKNGLAINMELQVKSKTSFGGAVYLPF